MDEGDRAWRPARGGSAQSNAESPPPTMTTSLPAYGAKLGTKNSMPRPSQPSPAGSGRGLNLPMPAVMSSAFARTSVPSSRVTRDVVVGVVEADGGAVEEVVRLGGVGLLDQALDEVAALDRREAGDVEDLLLGVHRGDLPAELGQGVDHRDPQPAEPGVVGGVEAGGAGPDDRQVCLELCHVAPFPEWFTQSARCRRASRGRCAPWSRAHAARCTTAGRCRRRPAGRGRAAPAPGRARRARRPDDATRVVVRVRDETTWARTGAAVVR